MAEKKAVVFSADATKLSAAKIKELETKFGLKLQVRASNEAIEAALGRIGEAAIQTFDRTNPSYGRVYDKASSVGDIRDQIINPVELEGQIRRIAGRVVDERANPNG